MPPSLEQANGNEPSEPLSCQINRSHKESIARRSDIHATLVRMNRLTEVEILAATLDEPSRSLLLAALSAVRAGRLGAAGASVSKQVERRPSLAWPALLIALEIAELRLAGAVAIATPRTRFAASSEFPLFEERWGPFGCIVWPAAHKVRLRLLKSAEASFELRTAHDAPQEASEQDLVAIGEAIGVVTRSLEDCLGVGVRRVSVDWTALESEPN